jgi:hypothetical protein
VSDASCTGTFSCTATLICKLVGASGGTVTTALPVYVQVPLYVPPSEHATERGSQLVPPSDGPSGPIEKLPLATPYALASHHPYGGPPGALPEKVSDTLIVSACPVVTAPLSSPVTTTPAKA